MRIIVGMVLVLILAVDEARADARVLISGDSFQISCNTKYSGFNYRPGDHIAYSQQVRDKSTFLDDASVGRFVQETRQAAESACKGRSKTGRVAIRIDGSLAFWAVCVADGTCTVTNNGAKADAAANMQRQAQQRVAEDVRRQAALQDQQRKQAATAKAQRLADQYRADGWIPWAKVNANQFAYDGKVLMVITTFERMLTSDTAQFGDPLFAQPVVAAGVPRTAFTEQRHVILVGRITTSSDERASQIAGIGIPVIRMRYIGHEFCSESRCTDFTGQGARN